MSKLQFSWKNQKGYGLALLFFGWALIIQIPAFYQNYLIIKVQSSSNDWLLFLAVIISVTVILGSLIATIFENLFDPFDSTLINVHTVVLLSLIVFYFFYLLAVPFVDTVEPFLQLPVPITITGWTAFIFSIVTGLLGMALLWYTSESLSSRN